LTPPVIGLGRTAVYNIHVVSLY